MNIDESNNDLDRLNANPSISPQRKNEKVQAWLLTIILHVILASALIGYWYFSQRHQAHNANTITLPAQISREDKTSAIKVKTTTEIQQIKPTSSAASAPLVTADDDFFTALPVTFNAPNMYFFALGDAPATDSKNMTAPVSLPPITQSRPVLKPSHATPNDSMNKILTKRDVPHRDLAHGESAAATSKQPKTKSRPEDVEVARLTDDLDVDNAEIDRLINQVKTKNQQKIDADTTPNPPSDTAVDTAP